MMLRSPWETSVEASVIVAPTSESGGIHAHDGCGGGDGGEWRSLRLCASLCCVLCVVCGASLFLAVLVAFLPRPCGPLRAGLHPYTGKDSAIARPSAEVERGLALASLSSSHGVAGR